MRILLVWSKTLKYRMSNVYGLQTKLDYANRWIFQWFEYVEEWKEIKLVIGMTSIYKSKITGMVRKERSARGRLNVAGDILKNEDWRDRRACQIEVPIQCSERKRSQELWRQCKKYFFIFTNSSK